MVLRGEKPRVMGKGFVFLSVGDSGRKPTDLGAPPRTENWKDTPLLRALVAQGGGGKWDFSQRRGATGLGHLSSAWSLQQTIRCVCLVLHGSTCDLMKCVAFARSALCRSASVLEKAFVRKTISSFGKRMDLTSEGDYCHSVSSAKGVFSCPQLPTLSAPRWAGKS